MKLNLKRDQRFACPVSILSFITFLSTHLLTLRQTFKWHHKRWVRTSVGERQRCLLSPTLLNIFLKQVMTEALPKYGVKVSVGSRNITNLLFVDDAVSEEEQELEALVESLDKTCLRYRMEIMLGRPN